MKSVILSNSQPNRSPVRKSLVCSVFVAVLAIVSSTANGAVVRITPAGTPLTFAGANFNIFALQDITTNPLAGTSAIVNRNFEFQDSIGVTYSKGASLTDFGIGLYEGANHETLSTGLRIDYITPVLANSAIVTVEDFDIDINDTFFKEKKVEPSITLLGPGGSVLGTALPAQIFPFLIPNTTIGEATGDVWDINLGALFGLGAVPISGVILFADQTAGEDPTSDPYLLVAVGNGTQIPEPSTAVLVIVAGGLATIFHLRRRSLTR